MRVKGGVNILCNRNYADAFVTVNDRFLFERNILLINLQKKNKT